MQLFILIVVILIVIIVYGQVKEQSNYKKSSYYQITKNRLSEVKKDKGRIGEYLIYEHLKNYEKQGAKFLFNCYLNKKNGQTTEIDVIMLHSTGIFVFESKNYKGWIYGNEKSTNWTQVLSMGKGRSAQKYNFYNPIKQNEQHIYHLRKLLNEEIPIYSMIVFSDDCIFKKINIKNSAACVIQLHQLKEVVESIIQRNIDYADTYNIIKNYNTLYPYTQVSNRTKQQHIENIRSYYNKSQKSVKNRQGKTKKPTRQSPNKSRDQQGQQNQKRSRSS